MTPTWQVLGPAVQEVEAMLAGVEQPTVPADNDAAAVFAWQKHHCSECDRTLNGEHEWAAHLKSRGHRKKLHMLRKRKAQQQAVSCE